MAVTQSNTDVIKFATATDAVTSNRMVMGFVWYKPTTAGHDIKVTDTNGTVYWEYTTAVNNESQQIMFPKPLPMQGITVATMDSGDLYAYCMI